MDIFLANEFIFPALVQFVYSGLKRKYKSSIPIYSVLLSNKRNLWTDLLLLSNVMHY